MDEVIGGMFALWLERYGDYNGDIWVAELIGKSKRFGFEREFLKGLPDHRQSNSKGTRGVRLLFMLEEGRVYEINARTSWSRRDRYFATVVDGEIERLTPDAVAKRLALARRAEGAHA